MVRDTLKRAVAAGDLLRFGLAAGSVRCCTRRRSFAHLVLDALPRGPQPRAEVIAATAERTGLTRMTIRNTLARAKRTGWMTQGETVAATAMARERVGRMAAALRLRWELLLEVLALLAHNPALAVRLDAAVAGEEAPQEIAGRRG